ncbi:MAG: winged helix-turn-helix transcriptional regulator [Actinobacteria bacterium]|nr:winged helix-turn-helix transcriptional regulator [Actinomycetota bacterium]
MKDMASLKRVDGLPTWLLSRANARAQAILHDAFGRAGVRGYHFRVLAALEEFGPVSQANLGRRTGIDRSDIVATLNDLVVKDLVSRAPDSNDRRQNVVTITRPGEEMLRRLDVALTEVQDVVLEPLNDRERATLIRLLAKLG